MLLHRRSDHRYIRIVRGRGCYLYDEAGNAYLDAVGGAAVAILGHGLEEIASQAAQALQRYSFIHGAQFTTPDLETYGERLVALAPPNISHVQLVGGGSEAVETAIKLAYQYYLGKTGGHHKYKVIATDPGYHGATGIALAVTGKTRDRQMFQGLLRKQPFIPSPNPYRRPIYLDLDTYGNQCAALLEQKIVEEGPDNCLAFIVEPVIGASMGVCVPPPNYLQRVREICDLYDIALICDEVMCGFGRCGTWFTSSLWDIQPDIIVQGKGMAAGLVPLAAVYASRVIVEGIRRDFGNFFHGFTFTNHAFAATVGHLVLDHIDKNNLMDNVYHQGEYLRQRLRELTVFPWVDDVRGLGLLNGFELVADKASRKAFPRAAHVAERLLQRAMTTHHANFYFSIGYLPDGSGDAILVMPPYNITREESDHIIALLHRTIAELDDELRAEGLLGAAHVGCVPTGCG